MRIYIGSDHAGFELKGLLAERLRQDGHVVVDVGASGEDSVDYPDYALDVAQAVAGGQADRGILVCGTGIGMAMAANRVRGVRAAPVSDPELARMARSHNDANVIALGARYTDEKTAWDVIQAFLNTPFEGGRHARRVEKIDELPGNKDERE